MGYRYSKGIISQKYSYKGKNVQVKYQINGVSYESTRGWDSNPKRIGIGDSITFRYAISNPNLIITELEDSY